MLAIQNKKLLNMLPKIGKSVTDLLEKLSTKQKKVSTLNLSRISVSDIHQQHVCHKNA